jgi:predicted ester cyclase
MRPTFVWAICLGGFLALASCGGSGNPKDSKEYKELKAELDRIKAQDSTENAQIEAYKKMNEDFMKGRKDEMLSIVADDYVDHNADTMLTKKKGKEALADMMEMIVAGNSDMAMDYTKISSEGDMVYVFGKMRGKNTGDMGPGMPATNKSYNVDFFEAVRFENGKIKERWGLMDTYAMMSQLGMQM